MHALVGILFWNKQNKIKKKQIKYKKQKTKLLLL